MYLEVNLKGGLCNKLFCLLSAYEIAKSNNLLIIEPEFGWNQKILFSDIYDFDYFNNSMENGKENGIIIKKNKVLQDKNIKKIDSKSLWAYSENLLKEQRKNGIISQNSTMIKMLKSLKLNDKNKLFIERYTNISNQIATQFRVEKDWYSYSLVKQGEKDETVYVSIPDLVGMLLVYDKEDLFFTSGESHEEIKTEFEKNNLSTNFFYDSNLEYEINAAINFELCCNSKIFIGNSRSTFSNLISLKRAIVLNNNNSYIYNYKNKILKRCDYGLYPMPSSSVSKAIVIY